MNRYDSLSLRRAFSVELVPQRFSTIELKSQYRSGKLTIMERVAKIITTRRVADVASKPTNEADVVSPNKK